MAEQKIIDRIRKLLALARDAGATEGEAANAMAMASRLMLEHNVKHIEEVQRTLAVKGDFMHQEFSEWARWVAGGVSVLYSCRNVYATVGGDYLISFVGKPDNVAACEMTTDFIVQQIEALYKMALREFGGSLGKAGRAELRKTFKTACAQRVAKRCHDIAASNRGRIPSHKALVVIDQALAQANDLLKHMKKGKPPKQVRPGLGTISGWIAGDQVKIQQEVE